MFTAVTGFSPWGPSWRVAFPSQPSVANVSGSSVPYVHAPEVGTVRAGPADTVNDGQVALLVDALEGAHRGVKSHLAVQLEDIILGQSK